MGACGPFLLRKRGIIAAAQAAIHAVFFTLVERTTLVTNTDLQRAMRAAPLTARRAAGSTIYGQRHPAILAISVAGRLLATCKGMGHED